MATTQIVWAWLRAGPGTLSSVDVNFPPDFIGAQVSLHGVGPEGTAIAGIRQFRRRLSNGADEIVDFGAASPLAWPPAAFDFMSSVSIGAFTSSKQNAFISIRLDHWA